MTLKMAVAAISLSTAEARAQVQIAEVMLARHWQEGQLCVCGRPRSCPVAGRWARHRDFCLRVLAAAAWRTQLMPLVTSRSRRLIVVRHRRRCLLAQAIAGLASPRRRMELPAALRLRTASVGNA